MSGAGNSKCRWPGRYPDGQLRTLQRRINLWRALEGPPKEVFFAQTHHPGRLGESDFTHMTALGVTIGGSRSTTWSTTSC